MKSQMSRAAFCCAGVVATFATLTASALAQATPITPELQKVLKSYQVAGAEIGEDKVLRVVMKKLITTWEVAETIYTALCHPANNGVARPWGNAGFNRVEVLNDIGKQGYSLPISKAECKDMGEILADEATRKKRHNAAWVCVAGRCRERRPGEIAAGDK